jgi:hypothetical protein
MFEVAILGAGGVTRRVLPITLRLVGHGVHVRTDMSPTRFKCTAAEIVP